MFLFSSFFLSFFIASSHDTILGASRRRPTDVLGGLNLDQEEFGPKNKKESDDFDLLDKTGQLCGLLDGDGFRPHSFPPCKIHFPFFVH